MFRQEINIVIDIDKVYIGNDTSSGCKYTCKNNEEIKQVICDYIDNYVNNYDIDILGHTGDKKNGYSIHFLEKNTNLHFWMDLYIVGNDIQIEWNKYIFDLTNDIDLMQRHMQDNDIFYGILSEESLSYAIENCLVKEDNDYNWYYI